MPALSRQLQEAELQLPKLPPEQHPQVLSIIQGLTSAQQQCASRLQRLQTEEAHIAQF